MTISTGTRLGPYEVLAPIGAGGMGEVYKAKDTRLDRIVAIKVLPEHLAESPERKARFEREAKAISQLNHPHICTLYDVGEQDSLDFIVMEYIEGETLAERLKKGALKLDRALEYGIQIADGLDKAHRAGIVHRDLKPANVMLTKSGVKLLDFGLARLLHDEAQLETSDAPTRQQDLTKENAIIGTLQYMAPEQLEGKATDARTDVFAFGVVLYEMVTGKRAFDATSQASLIAAIMERDPPAMSTLQTLTPAQLDHVVGSCLAKEPDQRWQSVGDVARSLRWIASAKAQSEPGRATSRLPTRPTRERLMWGAVVLALGGAVVWNMIQPGPSPPRVKRFSIGPPGTERLGADTQSHSIAISPDGTRIVYPVQIGPNLWEWYVRPLQDLEGMRLQNLGTFVESPVVSPDNAWVVFNELQEGVLKKVSLLGGPPITVSNVSSNVRGASWGTDERIVFGTQVPSGLWSTVVDAGSEPEEITTPEPGSNHLWPEILPGGNTVLFTIIQDLAVETARIAALDLETGEQHLLVPAGTYPRFSPTGHLVYAVDGTLQAVPFDAERLQVAGNPVTVVEGVVTKTSGAADYAIARDGSLIYLSGVVESLPPKHLIWVDRDGREETLPADPRVYGGPVVSPDGTRIAMQVAAENTDVWILDLARNTSTRLTFDPMGGRSPLWTPDGNGVVYRSPGGPLGGGLIWRAADGTGEGRRFLESASGTDAFSWSADGRLLFDQRDQGGRNIGVLSVDGEPHDELLLASPFSELRPAISRDGRWLAFESNESGQAEIYVRPFPDVNSGKWQVSSGGGEEPKWSPDGQELFYLGPENMMSVRVQTDPSFAYATPEALFSTRDYFVPESPRRYDVAPDGRFLMLKTVAGQAGDGESPVELILVQDWFEELKRLVPTAR